MIIAIFQYIGPEVFNKPLLYPLISFEIQHTLITLCIIFIFALLIFHEPITHLFSKPETEYKRFEAKHFWQTVLIIPLFGVPFLWIGYTFGIFEFFPNKNSIGLMALQFIAMLVLHDSYFYWCHRLLHTKILWKIHSVHHRAVKPTVISSHMFHFVETFINYTFTVWFIIVCGLIFGGVYYLPIMMFVVFTIFWNAYGHGNTELFPASIRENFPGKYFIWSTYHHLHHSQGRGNYGFLLVFWDKIMKTAIKDKH